MDANAISPTESVLNEMRIMIVALGMRRRAWPELRQCFLQPATAASNNWSKPTK